MKIDIDELVATMREVADDCVPYTFPKNHPKLETEMSFMKTRHLTIDGYDLICYLSRSDYGEYYQETFQILSVINSFLPFHLVIKVAQRFLGSHNLYLTEVIKNNKKLYLWTIWVDKSGRPAEVKHQKFVQECVFDDVPYRYVLPNQMNFH